MISYISQYGHGVKVEAEASVRTQILLAGGWSVNVREPGKVELSAPFADQPRWVLPRETALLLATAITDTIREYDEEAARWKRTP